MQHACADRGVGELVDQDEASQRTVVRIGLEHEGFVGRHLGDADGVQLQRPDRQMLQGVDVDLIFRGAHRSRHGLGAQLQPIGPARYQRFVRHPDDRGLKLIGDLGRIARRGDDVPARAVELVGEAQGDRLACHGPVEVAIHGDDAVDDGGLAAGQDLDSVAGAYGARADLAGETAEVRARAIDPLHRHAKRLGQRGVAGDLDGVEVFDQRRAAIPGHQRREGRDVVAPRPGDRHGDKIGDPNPAREVPVGRDNFIEHRLVIVDQVHLVHGQHDVADADHVSEIAVTAGLRQDALAGIDENDGEVGSRGAGDHVARVLFMSWRVGDDEFPLLGGEEAIGDIDGDALLALGGQAVDQECEVDRISLGPDPSGIRLERGELVLKDHLRIVEQPPDQG